MRYPAAFLEQLRRSVSVSGVIGARIPVKRHGREFQALCPFHKEKTPSFTINDEKAFFHCFGCGAHGDAIGFIKDYDGISYKEAIEKLAGEAGLALPQPTKEAVEQDKKRRSLQDVNELACRWFEAQLAGAKGFEAREYIVSRGINADIVQRFRIGYAPEDRNALQQALKSQGVSDGEMVAAGLLIQPDDASRSPYCRFRGRVMFAIRDGSSKVVAFGGRLMVANDNAPKYLNSPETELFHKGTMLYNYDLARRALRDDTPMLVCEGYMDVIALAQAGIATAVAPMGTAVTPQQLQQLWQISDEPVMCLDGDNAGLRAMNRAAEVALPMLQPDKSMRFMLLPTGEDPDTLVRSVGKQEFLARSAKSLPMVEQLCKRIMSQPATTPEAKAGQEQSLYALADHIEHAGVKAHYRDYIRQQFWNRSRGSGAKKKQSRENTVNSVPNLPVSGDLNSRKSQAIIRGFALLFSYGELSSAEEAEWFLSEVDVRESSLRKWQSECLSLLSTGLGKSQLEAAPEYVRRKIEQERQFILQQVSGDPRQPKFLWQQMMTSYRHACLLEDYLQAERELAESMTPERFERFAALKVELEAIDAQYQKLQQDQLYEQS